VPNPAVSTNAEMAVRDRRKNPEISVGCGSRQARLRGRDSREGRRPRRRWENGLGS